MVHSSDEYAKVFFENANGFFGAPGAAPKTGTISKAIPLTNRLFWGAAPVRLRQVRQGPAQLAQPPAPGAPVAIYFATGH